INFLLAVFHPPLLSFSFLGGPVFCGILPRLLHFSPTPRAARLPSDVSRPTRAPRSILRKIDNFSTGKCAKGGENGYRVLGMSSVGVGSKIQCRHRLIR